MTGYSFKILMTGNSVADKDG